jgi:hypothetical protein
MRGVATYPGPMQLMRIPWKSGVVDRQMQSTERIERGLHRISHSLGISHIRLDRTRPTRGRIDRSHERIQSLLIVADDNDARPAREQTPSDAFAVTRCRASDDSDAILELLHLSLRMTDHHQAIRGRTLLERQSSVVLGIQ